MDSYNLGRDIQLIKESLQRIESVLNTTPHSIGQQTGVRGEFDGGITISNVRAVDETICADIKVWATAESPSGDTFDWEESYNNVCVTLGGSFSDIFSDRVGPALIKIEACHELGKICIKFKVKVFGLLKTWKECGTVGGAADALSRGVPTGRGGK